jgi:hypothetical protein
MTHVKNAACYSRLVDCCTGLGGTYNPGRPTLQLDALMAQEHEVKKALEAVLITKSRFDTVVNTRKQVFTRLRRLISSILRTLEASGVSDERLQDVRGFARHITGSLPKHRAAVPSAEVMAVKRHSILQMAYVSQADAFAKVIEAVSTEPLYLTHEQHLSVAGLRQKLEELNALNQEVVEARGQWSRARIHRNALLYGKKESVYESMRAVRRYVNALFGLHSEQYALVKYLIMIKPRKI